MGSRVRLYNAAEAAALIQQYSDADSDTDNDSEVEGEAVVEEIIDDESDDTNDDDDDLIQLQGDKLVSPSGDNWLVNAPAQQGQARAADLLQHRGGTTRYAVQRIHTSLDSLKVIITDDILQTIVLSTNNEGYRVYGDTFVETGAFEIQAFIGLFYMRAIYQGTKEPLQHLWNPVHGRPIFSSTMGIQRFKLLLRILRFDDKTTINAHFRNDKFATIREIFTSFQDAILRLYWPRGTITIDEQLYPSRNRCPFLQYMPKKPSKFGIKFWMSVDKESHYVLTIQPYLGKENEHRLRTPRESVVLKLVAPFKDSGCELVTDNFFTSLTLARQLKQYKMTLLGTVRLNRREIPKELKSTDNRARFSSKFAFHENRDAVIVSYIPKLKKNVVLLTSGNYRDTFDNSTKKKPHIILEYNKKKCGVDTVDQMITHFSTKIASRRWPLAVFCNMLDIAMLNAYVLWGEINGTKMSRFSFIHEVATSLLSDHKAQRETAPQEALLPTMIARPQQHKRSNCQFCDKDKRNKTGNKCAQCNKWICGKHVSKSQYICQHCDH